MQNTKQSSDSLGASPNAKKITTDVKTIKTEIDGVAWVQCATCNFDITDKHDCNVNLEKLSDEINSEVSFWDNIGSLRSDLVDDTTSLTTTINCCFSDLHISKIIPSAYKYGRLYATRPNGTTSTLISIDHDDDCPEVNLELNVPLPHGTVLSATNLEVEFHETPLLTTQFRHHETFPIKALVEEEYRNIYLQSKSLRPFLAYMPRKCFGTGFLYSIGNDVFVQYQGTIFKFKEEAPRANVSGLPNFRSNSNILTQVKEYFDTVPVKPEYTSKVYGPPHTPVHFVTMNVGTLGSFKGFAPSIKQAKTIAASHFLKFLDRNPTTVLKHVDPTNPKIHEIVYDSFKRQAGDMEEKSTGNNPATETETSRHINQDDHVSVQGDALTGSTANSDTAIDTTRVTPGTTSTRKVVNVYTPSGEAEAILMTDTDTLTLHKQKYLMSASPPEWSIVWNKATSSIVGQSTEYSAEFNSRTQLQMVNFQHYACLGLWKLVAPIALFQSQRLWVSFKPDGAVAGGFDAIGFEWNPSEEAEIYVLTPWTATTRTLPVGPDFPDTISITPITDLIYSEGQPTSLDVDVYFAPHEMSMYTPNPVGVPNPPVNPGSIYREYFGLKSGESIDVSVSGDTFVFIDDYDTSLVTGNGCEPVLNSSVDGPLINILSNNSLNEAEATFELTNNGTNLTEGDHTIDFTTNFNPDAIKIATFAIISSNPINITSEPNSNFTRQIGGLTYDDNNNEAKEDFGQIANHTSRLDSHWGLIASEVISSTTDQLLFNIFSKPNAYIWDDLNRHLLFSKYPTLQFRATSIPSANLKIRITQLPNDAEGPIPLELALQLPGKEMNIKAGDVKIQPYFNDYYTGVSTSMGKLQIQVDVIGGSMGLDPVYISCLANPANIEYFHLKGFEGDANSEETFTRQLGSMDPSEIDPQIQSSSGTTTADSEKVGVTESERRWQYVDSFQISESTGGISIPIDNFILGKHFYRHLRRYNLWKGRPRIKLMFTNARILSGNIHVTQTSSPVPSSSVEAYTLLDDIGYTAISPADPAAQLELKWRNRSPFIKTTATGPDSTLGYLNIIIPELSAGNSSSVPTSLICTIHVDTSDIELKAAQPPSSLGDWQRPTIISMPRPAARVV